MFIVTGATGHIGNSITRYLLDQSEQVRLLTRSVDASLVGLAVDIQKGNLLDCAFLSENIEAGDIVIHCAGYIDLKNRHQLSTYRVNYLMTKKIADVCYEKRARFVYMSSVDAIYKQSKIIKEPFIVDPKKVRHTYSKSKALATKYVHRLIRLGLNGIVLYPSAVIGTPDYKPSKVGQTLLKIKDKRFCFAIKGGYNFIDIKDVATASYLAAKSNLCEDLLLTNQSVSIQALYKHIGNIKKHKKYIITLPTFLTRLVLFLFPFYSKMMIDVVSEKVHYDNHKMTRIFNLKLQSFESTLKDTVEWLELNEQHLNYKRR
jgi:dihydroflavonol-4-reductase